MLSRVRLCVTPGTTARQALLSIEFCRQEYWNGLPFPSPGDLPDPGTEPESHISCIGGWVLNHCSTWECTEPIGDRHILPIIWADPHIQTVRGIFNPIL